jgi:drug/metabolite transporter (DMT)-like permease
MIPTRRNPTLLAHLLLLGVVLVWGTTFSIIKAALADTTPLVFNLIRMTLAFLLLAAVNVSSLHSIPRRELAVSAAAGCFLALGYQFQTVGLNYTSAAKAGFITGLVVVLVPLLSILPGVAAAGSPGPSRDTYTGAFLAFAGLVLLTAPSHTGLALFSGIGLGELLCLACAVAFSAHLLTLAHAAPQVSARRLGTLQIGFAALVMLLTFPLGYLHGGHPTFHGTPAVWLALAVTSVLATAAAFTIQSWAQQHLPASHTALIFTLEPVFAWLTALLFFGERLGPRAIAGAALILVGILLAELRPTSRAPQPLQQAESVDPPMLL